MSTIENQSELVKTARIAGAWYLAMAISGILGFLIYHSQVYVTGDAQKTLTNLVDFESLARTRLLLEFAIVISQALTAVWFYKLFKNINEWAALTTGIWGTVNAVMIMISALAMATAIGIAGSSQGIENKLIAIELLSGITTNAWGIGGLFFGLWLIPLGYIVVSSNRMPLWLGWTLIGGGFGYLISTALSYAGIESSMLEYLTLPATIGEFWMIGYLFVYGIRPSEGE